MEYSTNDIVPCSILDVPEKAREVLLVGLGNEASATDGYTVDVELEEPVPGVGAGVGCPGIGVGVEVAPGIGVGEGVGVDDDATIIPPLNVYVALGLVVQILFP